VVSREEGRGARWKDTNLERNKLIVDATAIGDPHSMPQDTVKGGFVFCADPTVLSAKLEQLGCGTCTQPSALVVGERSQIDTGHCAYTDFSMRRQATELKKLVN
jgi:hypothetical protein